MNRIIQMKRGLELDLPVLNEGEFGFTIDTKKLFIGSDTGNVQMAREVDLKAVRDEFNTHKAESVQQGGGVHGLIVEKGTWTPTLNSDQNVELDIQTGSYVRIGDIVHCFMDIQIGNMGSWSGTQTAVIRGLPFVAKNSAPNSVAEYSRINLPGSGKDMFFIVQFNIMYLRSNRGSVDSSATSYVASHFGVGSRIRTSFSYQI